MAAESLCVQQISHPDEGSSLRSLRDAESILQALATRDGDSKPFSAFESDSNSEYSAHSNYRSSHDTLDRPEDEESNTLPIPEPELTELEAPDRQAADQPPTPPHETSKEEEERPPTPKEEEERPLTPPAHVPTPDEDICRSNIPSTEMIQMQKPMYMHFGKLGKQIMCHNA